MALRFLLDTSVLTRLSNTAVYTAIEPNAERDELARVGISDLEIGFAARDAPEWDQLAEDIAFCHLVETTADHVRRAREVQRLLAVKHQRGRSVPDLLIAAAAEANSLTVLHYDANFDLIAGVTGQPCQWVVARGSVN